MTNEIKKIIINAINAQQEIIGVTFHNLDEVTDTYEYSEIIKACINYINKSDIYDFQKPTLIIECITALYNVTPRTIDEVMN